MLLILAVLIILPLTCAANPADADAKNLLSVAKEIRFTVEAGADYRTYSDQATKGYIEYKKFEDKHPGEFPDASRVFTGYRDAASVWQGAIYNRDTYIAPNSAAGQTLISRYPSLGKIKAGPVGMYYRDIIPAIWRDTMDAEKQLEAQIGK